MKPNGSAEEECLTTSGHWASLSTVPDTAQTLESILSMVLAARLESELSPQFVPSSLPPPSPHSPTPTAESAGSAPAVPVTSTNSDPPCTPIQGNGDRRLYKSALRSDLVDVIGLNERTTTVTDEGGRRAIAAAFTCYTGLRASFSPQTLPKPAHPHLHTSRTYAAVRAKDVNRKSDAWTMSLESN
ncbi:hypothetical protein BD410DRAFT_844442 [Rickenella mellea]|uniref:Uncharacterized protein n=1 Tax=Rickenella mellea TaxID=50990 RepID=A0A4Y7PMH0_9AGAM|nr:hypothetical protein BD410DRAFT_844442 [Rickenella mellea]